jgi:CheY-like chemotaxis protein
MRRILVVDDDAQICLAARAWLKRYGFKVAIADGGAAGLAAPEKCHRIVPDSPARAYLSSHASMEF